MKTSGQLTEELNKLKNSYGNVSYLLNQSEEDFMATYRSIPMREMGDAGFEKVMAMLSGKWKVIILGNLYKNPSLRYTEIKRNLQDYGITNHVLNQSLKELLEDHLIEKKVYPEVPPHTEYSVTQKSLELLRVMLVANEWYTRHRIEEISAELAKKTPAGDTPPL